MVRAISIFVTFVGVLGGCGFDIDAGVAPVADGGSDDSATGGEANPFGCYGVGIVEVCPRTEPVPVFEVSTPLRFDTSSSGNCTEVDGTNVTGTCVVVAKNIAIFAPIRAVGTRPLIIVATGAMTIDGSIDVSSRGDDQGAGASTTVCASGPGPDANLSGAGGGAGGSFGGRGGRGGNDLGGQPADAITAVTTVRGGCRGQSGSNGLGDAGSGGSGGGALYLIAAQQLTVSGQINASGRGGQGGELAPASAGAGGGGSGGMVVLDAPTVVVNGSVFAHGGGGGGGSDALVAGGGGHSPEDPATTPGGGGGGGQGGKGGTGGLGAVLDGTGGDYHGNFGVAGGGGGGGGVGWIQIYGALTAVGMISPAPR